MLSEANLLNPDDTLTVDIVSGPDAFSLWSDFEADAALTPYQHSAWIRGFQTAWGRGEDKIDLVVMSRDGQTIGLLPLCIMQRIGYRIAEIPGTDIGNMDWFPQRRDVKLNANMLEAAFSALAKQRGVDLIAFYNLPQMWQGLQNPVLDFPHKASPDNLYLGAIDTVRAANLPKRRRGDLLRSKRRLEEKIGPVTLRRARTEADIKTLHAAFIAQRNVRFREMGIFNVFTEPHFMRFFHDLGVASLPANIADTGDRAGPFVFRFDALYADEEILATALGIQTGSHYSQYINSNTDGPASKYSLIALLNFMLVEQLAEAGFQTIDMGLGDYNYKKVWSRQTPVFDVLLPLTARGRLLAPAAGAKRSAKHLIKRNPTLWAAAKKVRGFMTAFKNKHHE